MRPSSIRRRIFARVLLIQLALGGLALLAVVGLARFEGDPEAVAALVAAPSAFDAVHRDGAGRLSFDCEGTLAGRLRADPGFWVQAWQGNETAGCNVPAAAAARAAAAADGLIHGRVLVAAGPGHGAFVLEKRGDGLAVAVGATLAPARSKVEMLAGLIIEHVLVILLLPLAGLVVALAAVPRDIHRALSRLSVAAATADPEGRGVRLDASLAPVEARGLVDSFNLLLDRVQELAARQRRFLADLAHEMGTPLAIMRLRLDDLPTSETRARLVLDLDRLGGRIEALLVMARLRAGTPLAEPVDLADIARDIVMDRAPRAAAAGCDLALEATPAAVLADCALVETAVTNLVDNAIAHAGPGACILVRVQPPGLLEVVDDGRGIPAGQRENLLEPFARLSEAGQLGLGLALVGEAVAAMGGRLDLVETPGGGNTARIRFADPA